MSRDSNEQDANLQAPSKCFNAQIASNKANVMEMPKQYIVQS